MNRFLGVALIVIFGLIAVITYLGNRDNDLEIVKVKLYSPSPSKSLTLLVISTILFVILLSLPIFFLGGSKESCFGTLLVTTCGLTVIITKSWKIRALFIVICMGIYIAFSAYYIQIIVPPSKSGIYTFFYDLGTCVSMGVTVFLSRLGEYTVFDV